MHGSWDISNNRQSFFVILDHFLPFGPPNNPKNQNFEKMKTVPEDIVLNLCTINENQDVWLLLQQNYFSFWTFFCPFSPLTTQKIKMFKKFKKTPGDIIILHKCTKNHGKMLYCSWDMSCDRCNCHFSFWAIFCHFTP